MTSESERTTTTALRARLRSNLAAKEATLQLAWYLHNALPDFLIGADTERPHIEADQLNRQFS